MAAQRRIDYFEFGRTAKIREDILMSIVFYDKFVKYLVGKGNFWLYK